MKLDETFGEPAAHYLPSLLPLCCRVTGQACRSATAAHVPRAMPRMQGTFERPLRSAELSAGDFWFGSGAGTPAAPLLGGYAAQT
jgi:hypothetical protein